MQGPLVEGRGRRARQRRGGAVGDASMQGPLVEGRGITGTAGGRLTFYTLQCRALSSRAGAGPRSRRRPPRSVRRFNAGPSRRGPGPMPAGFDAVVRVMASMQGPLVEGRGRGDPDGPDRPGADASMQGPLVEGRGSACPWCGSGSRVSSFNAGPSRRGPGRTAARGGVVRAVHASMQGPLVEGRGITRTIPAGNRWIGFNAGPSRRGPGPSATASGSGQ